jgi:hypothetical protein
LPHSAASVVNITKGWLRGINLPGQVQIHQVQIHQDARGKPTCYRYRDNQTDM